MSRESSRFTLRQFLAFATAVALLMGLLRIGWTSTSYRTYSILVVAIPILLSYCCYIVGCTAAEIMRPLSKARHVLFALLVVLIAVTGYALWARYRISGYSFARDEGFPRQFPYPDHWLLKYHAHLDAMHPAEPGYIKIHGEFPRLEQHLNLLALVCIGLSAVVAGAAMNRFWSQWIRTFSRRLPSWSHNCDDSVHIEAHRYCTNNHEQIGKSDQCGCFHCCRIFAPNEITQWINEPKDDGTTAICPYCGIDSVIGSASGFPMNRTFLRRMKRHWF